MKTLKGFRLLSELYLFLWKIKQQILKLIQAKKFPSPFGVVSFLIFQLFQDILIILVYRFRLLSELCLFL